MNTGAFGEKQALKYLQDNDYSFLTANFRTRNGEIDLICKQGDTYVFVEVKTRSSDRFGQPYEAVGFTKRNRMKRAIDYYLMQNNLNNCTIRADVISIMIGPDQTVKELKHFKNIEFD